MTQLKQQDLRQIFHHLEARLFIQLIENIRMIENEVRYVILNTRSRKNPNKIGHYFTLTHQERSSPVICAGREIRRNHLAVIRFRGINVRNHNITQENCIPYPSRKEEWIYVIINSLTRNSLLPLMRTESANYDNSLR
jgi:hypothetical protein